MAARMSNPAGRPGPRAGAESAMRIVIIDNRDSFTRNLEHLVAQVAPSPPAIVPVAEIDAVTPAEWDMVIISPGPGAPQDYPGYARIVDSGVPVLGVCLGMQILNAHFGGVTSRLAGCVHGRQDVMHWRQRQWTVARYHSLYVSTVGAGLDVLAANAQGVPFVLAHPRRPLIGYQFHPESFLTENGGAFIDYAFTYCGLA